MWRISKIPDDIIEFDVSEESYVCLLAGDMNARSLRQAKLK